MSWPWYPGAKGYEVADRAFNPAVGCTNVGCTERAVCWARRFALRQKPQIQESYERDESGEMTGRYSERLIRGCQQCYDFEVHEHGERWETFRAKPNQRIALAWGGDLFDLQREEHELLRHLSYCIPPYIWLIQTRHIERAITYIGYDFRCPTCKGQGTEHFYVGLEPGEEWCSACGGAGKWALSIQLGTSFTSPADLDNVRALAELPENVVRFIAFEPCNRAAIDRRAVESAKPDWAYIGLRTPRRGTPPQMVVSDLAYVGEWLNSIGCAVVYKRSCGPELYRRNEGTVLP